MSEAKTRIRVRGRVTPTGQDRMEPTQAYEVDLDFDVPLRPLAVVIACLSGTGVEVMLDSRVESILKLLEG